MNNINKVRMQLFGEFQLQKGTIVLNRASLHSDKLMKLLVYIILYRDKQLSKEEMIDLFWEDESKNPA